MSSAPPDAPQSRNPRGVSFRFDPAAYGTIVGLLSAAGYTAANIGLRSVAHLDPVWVSCVKSAPTIVLMVPWLLWLGAAGQRVLPTPAGVRALVVGALVGQLGGNVVFQWSLGVIGLALAVPLTTGSMILGGALLGRLLLMESITPRVLVSMLVLIAATFVLSFGAGESAGTVPWLAQAGSDGPLSYSRIALGVGSALLAGIGYAVLGVTIRRNVAERTPVPTVMFVVATVGVSAVGILGLARLGWEGIRQIAAPDYGMILAAGFCNTAAFVCLTVALRETSVTYVNSLSAAQVALAGVLGVLLFDEPFSLALVVGVVLTIVGLSLMQARRR